LLIFKQPLPYQADTLTCAQTKILATVVGWLVAAQAFGFQFFEPIF
jgi:hypothetical protein